jgi:hypothetical protein
VEFIVDHPNVLRLEIMLDLELVRVALVVWHGLVTGDKSDDDPLGLVNLIGVTPNPSLILDTLNIVCFICVEVIVY